MGQVRDELGDAIDRLETHFGEPAFAGRWRAVLRECATLLVPRLPPEVGTWMSVADAYEQRGLGEQDLIATRVEAWRFHDRRRNSEASPEELSALRVVMYRLWPDAGTMSDWHESARHFLGFCQTAGISIVDCNRIMEKRFPDILV
jgi:hypothetical protein